MKHILRENKTKEKFFNEIIDECDLLKANEELEVIAFGKNRNLKLHIVKDCEYDREQDRDYSNFVTIVTLQLFDKFVPVDDTENTYVTDGALYKELERIYNYRDFGTL